MSELAATATPPRPWTAYGPDFDYEDDDAGLWGADEDDEDETPWNDALRVDQHVRQIRARYEPKVRPLLALQRRNGGVRLPALVELERRREAEVQAVIRAHQQATAYARAGRDVASGRAHARAQERQQAQANLDAFARDLRGGRYTPDPDPAGRSIHDAWIW